jgi:hypothetical protein
MTNTELFLTIAVASVLIALVFTFAQLSNLEKKYKRLYDRIDDRIDDCAKKWSLERTDKEAREMREHINAIERHLGIVLVEEPARLVVKTGEPK